MIRTAFEAAGLTEAKVNAQSLLRTYRGFPKGLKTEIRTNGIPQTMGQVDRLVEKYHLTEKQRTALINLMDKASPDIRKVLARLLEVAKPRNTKITADGSNANSVINGIIARVIPDKSFTITANHVINRIIDTVLPDNYPPVKSAAGNIFASVNRYAGGDVVNRHQPDSRSPARPGSGGNRRRRVSRTFRTRTIGAGLEPGRCLTRLRRCSVVT